MVAILRTYARQNSYPNNFHAANGICGQRSHKLDFGTKVRVRACNVCQLHASCGSSHACASAKVFDGSLERGHDQWKVQRRFFARPQNGLPRARKGKRGRLQKAANAVAVTEASNDPYAFLGALGAQVME